MSLSSVIILCCQRWGVHKENVSFRPYDQFIFCKYLQFSVVLQLINYLHNSTTEEDWICFINIMCHYTEVFVVVFLRYKHLYFLMLYLSLMFLYFYIISINILWMQLIISFWKIDALYKWKKLHFMKYHDNSRLVNYKVRLSQLIVYLLGQ